MQVLMSKIRTPNVHPIERWVSVTGGAILAAQGIRRGRSGMWQVLTGAAMLERGITGKCRVYRTLGIHTAPYTASLPYELGVRARASVTINQPKEAVFAFWRQFENLPRFMRHLVSVDAQENNRSHWVAEGPGGRHFKWDAEIVNEIPNELIAWKSLPGSDVASAGSVHFKDAPGGRGTEVRVELQYNPPAGMVGAYTARLLGREPEQEIACDLKRMKQYLEGGEVATTEGQAKGPASVTKVSAQVMEKAFT